MNHIVCRCEDVIEQEIAEAVAAGVRTSQEIKFQTRAGMGFCQGRVCRTEIETILNKAGIKREEGCGSMTVRLPVRPTALGDLAQASSLESDSA